MRMMSFFYKNFIITKRCEEIPFWKLIVVPLHFKSKKYTNTYY